MTFDQFKRSIDNSHPPDGLSEELKSLWYDGKGNWDMSHNIAQEIPDKSGSWIHAYLHRKEGDNFNAQYWYSRAGQSFCKKDLQGEWEDLVMFFLQV